MHPLQKLSRFPLQIFWHESKSHYLFFKKIKGAFHLRVHKLFYEAPTFVLEAILHYVLTGDKESRLLLRRMAHLYFSQKKLPARALSPQGRVYDLQKIFERLQALLPVQEVSIGWSKRGGKKVRSSITLGVFDPTCRQIRINPILDDPEIPLYFVEFIVYHEMIHAIYPSQMRADGRCSIHSEQFKEMERRFPHFKKAKQWERENYQQRFLHGRA